MSSEAAVASVAPGTTADDDAPPAVVATPADAPAEPPVPPRLDDAFTPTPLLPFVLLADLTQRCAGGIFATAGTAAALAAAAEATPAVPFDG